jgi:lysophospholipase L1-like esterase
MKKKIFITSFIILSFILNIYLLISNDFPARIYNKFFLKASPPQNYPTYWMDRNNTFNNELINPESIVFVGDSHIQLFETESYFPNSKTINRGILGDDIIGLTNRIESILLKNPKLIVLEIGTNDLKDHSSSEIFELYKKLLTTIQLKKTKVIVTALFPLAENNYLTLRERQLQKCEELNIRIEKINKSLLNFCAKNNIKFVNINPEFFNNKSGLVHFLNNDGLHLNKKGYQLWAGALSKEI